MNDKESIEILRDNVGGIGESLTDRQKERIFLGPKNEPENSNPFDGEVFSKALTMSLQRHPIEWLEMS